MKKIVICIVITLVILILGGIIVAISLNPLRKSEEEIREETLELTPIGSSMEQVIEVIGNNSRWSNEHVVYIARRGRCNVSTEEQRRKITTGTTTGTEKVEKDNNGDGES